MADTTDTKEMSRWKRFTQKIKKTKGYKLLSAFVKSAAVGMLFAILCFVYDVYHDSEQDKQLQASIDKLAKIEQGLSTRYLGIFPEYIPEISGLFKDLEPADTVVIFEDVLYYGIKSRPKEFFLLNSELFAHAARGGSITVAYYNVNGSRTMGIFHKMIVESRIDMKYIPELNERRREEARVMREAHPELDFATVLRITDSIMCEKYFSMTRDDNPEKFKKDIRVYLSKDLIVQPDSPSSMAERTTHQMCVEIDSVKRHYLGNGKSYESITFYDYEQMYRGISNVIIRYYKNCGIEMLPLDEYLTMSCWMAQRGNRREVKTVLAFPSKYSTDEIGFYSQDEAFSKYISTMLAGVKQNVNQ